MSVLRNELQVALNNLHVAFMESADNYRNAATFVSDESVTELFNTVADDRDLLAKSAEEAIREKNDLPSVPDPDRQTGQQLLQWLETTFSEDQTAEVIDQRLMAESQLEQRLNTAEMMVIDEQYPTLRKNCLKSINMVENKLRSMKIES
ncbi:hypothetical protein [Pseudomaricurvus sp.]|uniref:hypothetical protein n=1 Tax=Pseudomaricurvus sp. TaxID=2004510 RepID=UPI003F6B27F2